MAGTIVKRAAKGFAWASASSAVKSVSHLVTLIVLGRILSPADFGVITAALVFGKLADILGYVGSGQVVVQRKQLSEMDIRVANLVGACSGLMFAGVALLFADSFAAVMAIPELSPVLKVYSIVFALKGFAVVPGAYLLREARFQAVALCNVAADVSLGLVAISLAVLGYGVWSLVFGYIGWAAVYLILVQLFAGTPYRWGADAVTIREFLKDSVGFTSGLLANYVANQGDYVVVGRVLGATSLGIYERVYQIMAFPVTLAGAAADKVLFSLMSRMQDSSEKVFRAVRATNVLAFVILAPMSGVVAVLAPELIGILLGEGWEAAVVPLRILSMAMVFRASYRLFDAHTRAAGAIYERAWRQVIYAFLVIAGAIVGVRIGLAGVAYFVVLGIFINYLLMAVLSSDVSGQSRTAIVLDLIGPIALAIAVLLAAVFTAETIRQVDPGGIPTVVAVVTVSTLLWSAILYCFNVQILGRDNSRLLHEYWMIVRPTPRRKLVRR